LIEGLKASRLGSRFILSGSSARLHFRARESPGDLDAYALAYNIASLLNNLFGRGKEPFWQQAYTNLVKFIILLHKVAFDYVTLFDVYECAINPDLLESRIKKAERRLIEADSALLWEEEYLKFPKDLEPFHFRLDTESNRYRAPFTPGLAAVLKAKSVQWEAENASRKNPVPAQKKAQLEAVRRWFFHDWRRIEPKLRTSIFEGISVFLSLFDDNPDVDSRLPDGSRVGVSRSCTESAGFGNRSGECPRRKRIG